MIPSSLFTTARCHSTTVNQPDGCGQTRMLHTSITTVYRRDYNHELLADFESYVATRVGHPGCTLSAVTKWPLPGLVARLVDDSATQVRPATDFRMSVVGFKCVHPAYYIIEALDTRLRKHFFQIHRYTIPAPQEKYSCYSHEAALQGTMRAILVSVG